jgi:hypothetical protein
MASNSAKADKTLIESDTVALKDMGKGHLGRIQL